MKRKSGNRKILRILSITLVFAMLFSTMEASGWHILADDLETIVESEAIAEPESVEEEPVAEPVPELVEEDEATEEGDETEEVTEEVTEPLEEEPAAEPVPELVEEDEATEEGDETEEVSEEVTEPVEEEPVAEPVPEPVEGTEEAEEAAEEPIAEAPAEVEAVPEPVEEEPVDETLIAEAIHVVNEPIEQEAEPSEPIVPAVAEKVAETIAIAYPAQNFRDATDDISVRVHAPEGVFPEGTEMVLTPVNPRVLIKAAEDSGEQHVSSAVAVDIVFVFEGEEIQPKGGVQVTLVARKALQGETHQAVTMDDGGNVEPVGEASPTRSTFDTDHFTVYGIIGGEYADDIEGTARYTYEFYAGTPGTDPSEWAKVDTRIVIFGEDVKEPNPPATGDGYYFSGWATEDGETLSFTDGLLKDVVPEDASEDKLIKAYAQYDRVFYVFFHVRETGSTDNEIYCTREGESGDSIDVDGVKLTSVEAPNTFVGWVNEDGKTVTGSIMIGEEDIHLYPDIRPGVTVTFDANEGQFGLGEDAAETYEVVIPKNSCVSEPTGASLPTRTGYIFDGWYTEAACETLYDFAKSVEEEFTLYAKWKPDHSSYILRVYRENEDDADYTIFSPGVRDGVKTGDPVPVSQIIKEFKDKNNLGDYKYFHLNGTGASDPRFKDNGPAIEVYDGEETPDNLLAAFDSNGNCVGGKNEDAVIAGDGSTIVRVNFSRDSFVLKFVFRWSDWVESKNRTYKYVADRIGTFNSNNGYYDYGTTLKDGTEQAASVKNNGGALSLAGTERIIKYGQSLYQAAYEGNPVIQGFFRNSDWWFNAMFRSSEGQTRFDTSNMDFKLKDFAPRNGSGQTARDGDTLFCVIRWTTNQKAYPIRDIYYLSDDVDPENINKAVTPDEPNYISYNNGHTHTFTIGKIASGYKLANVTNYDPANSVISASGENKYYFKWDAEKGEYEELVCHWVPTDRKITFVQEAQADLELSSESEMADNPLDVHPYGTVDLESLINAKLGALRADPDNGKKWIAVTDTHGVAWACDGYRVTYADDGTEVKDLGKAKLERDLKVTLLWKPESYVVYYDPDDGSGDKTRTDVKAYDRAKSWKDLKEGNGTVPQKEGHIFIGWTACEPAGEGDNVTAGEEVLQNSFDFGTAITRNYYLKALWEPVAGFKVRYDAYMYEESDGESTTSVKGMFKDGQYYDDPDTFHNGVSVPVTAMQPTAEGYRFLGWRLPGADGKIVRGGSFPLDAHECDENECYVLTAVYGKSEETTFLVYHSNYPNGPLDVTTWVGIEKEDDPLTVNGEYTIEDDAVTLGFEPSSYGNYSYEFLGWTPDPMGHKVFADKASANEALDMFYMGETIAVGQIPAAKRAALEVNNLFTKLAGEAKSEAASNDLYAIWLVIVNDTPPVEPPTTKVEGSKVWDDNNDRDGMRPESITVTLHADGKEVEEKTISAADDWKFAFTELPKFDGKHEIVYTITEDAVPNYHTEIDRKTYTITNTYMPGTTTVTVEKEWEDAYDQDGIRPTSITVSLLADGEKYAEAELSAENRWKYIFNDLPLKIDDKDVTYTVEEKEVPEGYEVSYEGTALHGFTIINTHIPEDVDISIHKIWDDNDDEAGNRPESITVKLHADGKLVEGGEFKMTAAHGWAFHFENLPKYKNGHEIHYTITEDRIRDYTTTIDEKNFTITNTYAPGLTSVTVEKVWEDDYDQYGIRPDSITVSLLANGEVVRTITLTDENEWEYTFGELPEYEDGKEIAYTVREDDVARGYSVSYEGDADTGYLIINTIHEDDEPTPSRRRNDPPAEPQTPGEEIPEDEVPLGSGEDTPEDPGISEETSEEPGEDYEAGYEETEELDEEDIPLTPFTGDDRHTAAWGFLSILSLAGILLLGRRRKEE